VRLCRLCRLNTAGKEQLRLRATELGVSSRPQESGNNPLDKQKNLWGHRRSFILDFISK
jgi:hypothetical protein